jgi:tetrahydromethanopterin S-methyltransferase subunit G
MKRFFLAVTLAAGLGVLPGCAFWSSGPSDEQLRSAEAAIVALRTEREAIGRTLDALPAGELKEKLLVRYGELQALLPRIEGRLSELRSHSDRSWADVTAAGMQETGRQVGGPLGALIGLAGGLLAVVAGVKKRQAQRAVSEIVGGIEAAKAGNTVDLTKVVMGATGKDAVDAEQKRLGV